ncbi:hypothetical protein NA57DRAFT_42558 [Rhizodiscina lignyota]|uniref:Uncharacterized protein n=1 Tax=Rhizodiscina lignyota TaxID=1504668 RepID=A0A9P4IEQ7_9PEZI|nr:hypothetical protein NA57DRAFT_42558 [Rhizodiscina lignyota]
MAAVCEDSLRGTTTQTSPQALVHLSNTYRCLARNLQTDKIPADSTIAAVMSLAIHDDLRGQPARSKVHIDALQKMVQIRGGITEFLPRDHYMIHKICRADIEYALQLGCTPRFYRDEFPRELIRSMSHKLISQNQPLKSADDIQDPVLKGVTADLISVSRLVGNDRSRFKFKPYAYQEILISVSYRLLRRHPVPYYGYENSGENALHLALLAWTTTLIFQHGRVQRLTYGLLARELHRAIQETSNTGSVRQATLLWLLFVGGISVFGNPYKAWLMPQIQACLIALQINSWQDVRDILTRLPWIEAVHNRSGEAVWLAVSASEQAT